MAENGLFRFQKNIRPYDFVLIPYSPDGLFRSKLLPPLVIQVQKYTRSVARLFLKNRPFFREKSPSLDKCFSEKLPLGK